jgi:hypothetical protein
LGANCETYTAGSFMELESLGPLMDLEPGETAEHVEEWHLFREIELGSTDESLDAVLMPLVDQTGVSIGARLEE